jgi:hypothetical protein
MRTKIIAILIIPLLIRCGSNSKDNQTDRTQFNDTVSEPLKLDDTIINIALLVDTVKMNSSNIQDTLTSWTYTFKNHQIGFLKIGDSINVSIDRLEKQFNLVYDSIELCVGCFDEFEYFYRVLNESNSTAFTVHPGREESNIGLIQHIKLYDKDYKSDKDIGIGSTAKEIKEKYAISQAYFDYENGLFFLTSDFKGSFRFECCQQDMYDDINFENPTIEIVPEDMIVDMIVIL